MPQPHIRYGPNTVFTFDGRYDTGERVTVCVERPSTTIVPYIHRECKPKPGRASRLRLSLDI